MSFALETPVWLKRETWTLFLRNHGIEPTPEMLDRVIEKESEIIASLFMGDRDGDDNAV